jgi:hypothetical protein
MFPVERNAWTHNLHVTLTVIPQWLAGTERDSVPAFQYHLLFEQKIHHFLVGRKFEA